LGKDSTSKGLKVSKTFRVFLPRQTLNSQLNLNQLSTEEIFRLMIDDLYNGYATEVAAEVDEVVARGINPHHILTRGLIAAMDVVGLDFRDGLLFVPEVLMAARAMKAGMGKLRPLLAETNAPKIGKMVIGTVRGDIHDIGKSLVGMMMEGAGFEVIDLGINNSAEKFVAAVEKHQPDILGLSALLTTTSPYMGVVIDALEAAGLRTSLIVLVGGAPLNGALAEEFGADAYCRDATTAVETAKALMANRAIA
jgi:5-methyltetrahydrofolate--homocysteine methyltransferase